MAIEIERKFFAGGAPAPDQVVGAARLRQGYLALDGAVEVRLREAEGRTTMTVKGGSGLSRTEVEVVLDPADAAALWPHAAARTLEKVRERVLLDSGLVAELDTYAGGLAGLRTVEVEFPDDDAAQAFVPPSWFGPELTGAPGWSNADLAVHGRPDAAR